MHHNRCYGTSWKLIVRKLLERKQPARDLLMPLAPCLRCRIYHGGCSGTGEPVFLVPAGERQKTGGDSLTMDLWKTSEEL